MVVWFHVYYGQSTQQEPEWNEYSHNVREGYTITRRERRRIKDNAEEIMNVSIVNTLSEIYVTKEVESENTSAVTSSLDQTDKIVVLEGGRKIV